MTTGILFDTRVLIARVNDKNVFGKTTQHLFRSTHNLFYSPLSIAEMRLKEQVKRKSFLANDLVDGLAQRGYKQLALTSSAANDITRCPELHHRDPLDRLLIAPAETNNLLFITAEAALVNFDLELCTTHTSSPSTTPETRQYTLNPSATITITRGVCPQGVNTHSRPSPP